MRVSSNRRSERDPLSEGVDSGELSPSVVLVHPAAARAAAFRRSGLQSWEEGRLDEAREFLTAAVVATPRDPAILCDLGSVLRLTGDRAKAMKCFTTALESNPNHRPAWLNAGGLARETGDFNAAEAAFLEAYRQDARCGTTAASLGLLYSELNRPDEAIDFLSAAIESGAATAPIFLCLGQLFIANVKFRAALKVFARAARLYPTDLAIAEQHALSGLLETAIRHPPEKALSVYRSLAKKEVDKKTLLTAGRKAFLLLAGFGQRKAAVALGEHLLSIDPADLIVEHHLDALTSGRRDRAPPAYVVACFDRHAETFDKHLVEGLKYEVPAKIFRLLDDYRRDTRSVLDLGCGTGLVAPYLASFGGDITGVDLSPGMLAQAKKRGIYDTLVEADAIDFLRSGDAQFDLVVMADMLPYLGALESLFEAIAARVAPGGLMALSFESTKDADYVFLPSGRFAHSEEYIARLHTRHFHLECAISTALRLEARREVAGSILVLRRSG